MRNEYIYYQEGFVRSIVSDIFTFGSILAVLYFNHQYLSGNGWLDFFFVLTIMLLAGARNSKHTHRFNSKKDLLKYIQEK
jgi:hypothetical protein